MGKEKNDVMGRRGLPKSTGGMGALPLAKKTAAQMPPLVAANPLVGTIDMHVHAAPDSTSRALNDLELARRAKELGMRGVVIKNHEFITNDRAYLVRQVIPGIEVFGGIALNQSVGGINPEAVDLMLKFTGGYGKVVWLPTHGSAHHKSFSARKADAGGIRVIDPSGKVLPELRKVLKLIAKADVIFATGHVSRKEVLASVKAARQEGCERFW